MKKNFYELLGLTAQASPEQVKSAAVKLARQYNPKDHPNDPQIAAQFNQIKIAYATLMDPQRRAAYDTSLVKGTIPENKEKITLAFKEEPPDVDKNSHEEKAHHTPWLKYFLALFSMGVPIYLLWINPALLNHYVTEIAFLQDKFSQITLALQILLGFGSLMLFYSLFLQFQNNIHWFVYLLALLIIVTTSYFLLINPNLLNDYTTKIGWLRDKPMQTVLALQILLGLGIVLFSYALFLQIRQSSQESILLNGEVVIYRASVHWVIYLMPLLLIGISIYCLFIHPTFLNDYLFYVEFLKDKPDQIQWGLKILLGFAIWLFLYALYRQLATNLMITSKRTLCQLGLVFKKTLEVEHTSFENVGLDQSLFGKILFYGTIDVRGTNSQGLSNRRIKIRHIALPKKFKDTLLRSLKRHFL
ncbi:MAG: hypothetical protein BWK79_01555 [Beggiatoa sp. IS2]|nr:MAG: hypothetical protein BWK79_01555 [Beggiatoa sp. IS2]